MLGDIPIKFHENIIPPFPNVPILWEDLFGKHEKHSIPSPNASPICDVITLQTPTIDEHITSSPSRVYNMEKKNETLGKHDNNIESSPHLPITDQKENSTINHSLTCNEVI